MKKDEEYFEKLDGGHCYLRLKRVGKYVEIERWPRRVPMEVFQEISDWAKGSEVKLEFKDHLMGRS